MAQDIHKPSLGNWVEPTVFVVCTKPEHIFTWLSCPKILLNNDAGVQFCMNFFDQVYMKPLHTVGQLLA